MMLLTKMQERRLAKEQGGFTLIELLDRLDLCRDEAERCGHALALVVGVDAEAGEAADAVREVELALELQVLLLLGRRDAVDELAHGLGVEHREVVEQLDVTVHADRRVRTRGQVQVGGPHLDDALEEHVDGEGRRRRRVLHGVTYRQPTRRP